MYAPPLITSPLVPAPGSTASALLTGNTTQLDWMNSKASPPLTAMAVWINNQVSRVFQEAIKNALQAKEPWQGAVGKVTAVLQSRAGSS